MHARKPECMTRARAHLQSDLCGQRRRRWTRKKTDPELAALVTGTNEWLSRHARRQLAERAGRGKIVLPELEKAAREGSPHAALRALWALHATGHLTEALALELLNERAGREDVAAWTVQLACERPPTDAIRTRLGSRDKVEEVRLARELGDMFRSNYARAAAIARGENAARG